MSLFLALVLAVVELGGGFGGASVAGTETTATAMEIDLSVTLSGSAGPVLAHLVLPGESQTVPLVEQGEGTWEVLVEVRRADWLVVFEDVATGELSDSLSLTRLGLDPTLLGGPATATSAREQDGATTTTTLAWGWLAAAILAGGGAVALVFVGRRRPRHLRRRRRFRQSPSRGGAGDP